jgi:predicted mannosyl-3-phosphoglycerate phosphatase (HAD superfamily)
MHTASSREPRAPRAPASCTGLVFSDLDGTFLDEAYRPALDGAAFARVTRHWRVVWVSSRTAEELLHLQSVLGHGEDAIGENGGVCLCETAERARALGHATPLGDRWMVRLAEPVAGTRTLVRDEFARCGAPLRTVDEFSPRELALRSGYSTADAARALARETSVLIADADLGSASVREALDALRAAGCSVTHGGHWISVVRGSDKGAAALAWLSAAERSHGSRFEIVAAIGNADNDESLLRAVPRAFVARAANGSYAPRLSAIPAATLLRAPGTAGWTEMIEILDAQREDPR